MSQAALMGKNTLIFFLHKVKSSFAWCFSLNFDALGLWGSDTGHGKYWTEHTGQYYIRQSDNTAKSLHAEPHSFTHALSPHAPLHLSC